ncbi:MAG: hypothetical protein IT304_04805 [Dehalococcoidia bacterium]|nr:hypothetical protein [Dehalococcoidia bacterium]
MFLALDTLFGLPAHALVVHVAVVLVPLSAVAMAGVGWRPGWRRSYALPIAVLAIVGASAALLAAQSGETLEHSVRTAAETAGAGRVRFGEHPEQGDTARFFAVVFALAAVAWWGVDRWHRRFNLPAWAPLAVYGVALLPAVAAVVSMVVAGHSGATLVWKDVGTFAASR